VARIGDVLKSLAGHLGTGWELPLSDLSQGQIAGWRDGLAGKYAPVSVNVYLKIAKQALRDAWTDGVLSESPAAKIKLLKLPRSGSGKKVFTTAQYFKLLEHGAGEWAGIIHAGAFTGQRLSDIVSMRLEDIGGCWWRFKSRKTGAEMAIPLARPFLAWFRDWIERRKIASAYVFPESQATLARCGGRPASLSNQFHRIMELAGMADVRDRHAPKGVGRAGRRESSELSFHSFRHTCATWLKMQGVVESVAMGFVGHQTKAISRHYTHA
jgi:integrase